MDPKGGKANTSGHACTCKSVAGSIGPFCTHLVTVKSSSVVFFLCQTWDINMLCIDVHILAGSSSSDPHMSIFNFHV